MVVSLGSWKWFLIINFWHGRWICGIVMRLSIYFLVCIFENYIYNSIRKKFVKWPFISIQSFPLIPVTKCIILREAVPFEVVLQNTLPLKFVFVGMTAYWLLHSLFTNSLLLSHAISSVGSSIGAGLGWSCTSPPSNCCHLNLAYLNCPLSNYFHYLGTVLHHHLLIPDSYIFLFPLAAVSLSASSVIFFYLSKKQIYQIFLA